MTVAPPVGRQSLGVRPQVVLASAFTAFGLLGYLLVLPGQGGAASLWFPPAGLTFGYLVVVGPRGLPVALLVKVAGGLLVSAPSYHQGMPIALAADTAAMLWTTACAAALRRSARVEASFAALAAFLVTGVALAPAGSALIAAAATALGGEHLSVASWVATAVGQSTAVVSLAPAILLLTATLASGRSIQLRVSRRRRLEMVAQSFVIVLMPALLVFAGGVQASELLLVPLAVAPVAALTVQRDLTRATLVLGACSVALGAAAQVRFGVVSEPVFRLQVLMFAGAVATLFTAVALSREDRDRRSAEIDAMRWRAMAEVASAVVARIDGAGHWRFDERTAGLLDTGAIDLISSAESVPELARAVSSGQPATVQWLADPHGRHFLTHVTPLPDGETLAVTTETTALHSAELTIAWERSHDRGTDLPNRELLVVTADQVAATGTASLVVVDLDRAVRRAVLLDAEPARVVLVLADRVRRLLAPDALDDGRALVARLGDDQLGVLVPDGLTHTRMLAERIVASLRQPVPVPGGRLALGVWAGIAAVDTFRGARDCLDRAAAALEIESEHGHGGVSVLDALTVSTSTERARLVGDVVDAVGKGELEVVFQPDVALTDGRMTGVEALVRWRRREGITAATDLFVRLAEEAGAVQAIDSWVMEESLAALGRWRDRHGAHDLELGLNVSAFSLTEDLPERLLEACLRHDVPPENVRLEVTETALVDDSNAPAVLRRIRQRGVRVALDDFGTGYATLSRLHRLPVDVLKLDRSFLTPITEEVASQALVSLVLGLAGPLRVEVLVEGVENHAQRDLLVDLGCRRAQGYLFARPAPATTIDTLLADGGVIRADATTAVRA